MLISPCATTIERANDAMLAADDRHDLPVGPCVSHASTGETIKPERRGGKREGAGRPYKSPQLVTVLPDRFPLWCAVSTYYGAEIRAYRELTRSGYRGYMPAMAVMKPDRATPTMLHRVILPRITGYLFVQLGDPTWAPLLYIPGINKPLLSTRGFPSRVADSWIDRWMADDAAHLNITAAPMPALASGCRVELISGAMMGYSGTVIDCDGVNTSVNVGLFGGISPVLTLRRSVKEIVP